MKLSDYRILDADLAARTVADPDFALAFSGAAGLLGPCLVDHPARGAAVCASQLAALRGMDVAGDWPFGDEDARAEAQRLLDEGRREGDDELERAFTELFRGPGKLPAAPWGSVYTDREQVMYGDTWFELRDWMRAKGIAKAYAQNEPEDQIGRLLAMAGQVVRERPELVCELLGEFVLPWSGRFFELFVPAAKAASPTYGAVAVLARATLDDVRDLLGVVAAGRRLYR